MNKQQLAAKIWESANKMRSKIEANEYKDYILGFIFYKFLSDSQEKIAREYGYEDLSIITERNEQGSDAVGAIQGLLGYCIPYEYLFSTWIKQGNTFSVAHVRDGLSAFSRLIAPSHQKVFRGILDTLQTGLSKLGDTSNAQTRAVRDLLYLIKDIPMDGRQDYDVLGFIYEYLISNFAANAGKKAGEFYTPHEVSLLMSEIVAYHLKAYDEISIYDPTSGSGSLLINIGKAVGKYIQNDHAVQYYAQELKENTYNLTRMNLIMRGILPANIVTRNADTLEDDWPYFEEHDPAGTYQTLYVDAVVSNPPYSQQWNNQDKENDPRYREYGLAPKGKADYAFLLHDLYHVKADGIMTIVLPHGVLFRGNEEGKIRKNLIEKNYIDTIIGLPANIFFGTGIPTIIMVLKKNRNDKSGVLFIDASKGFEKVGKSNRLRARDIKKIADTFIARRNEEKFSRVVSIEEIRENDYNLNIPRYVDSSEKAESWDIYSLMFGGIPENELSIFDNYWAAFPNLKNDIFSVNGSYRQPHAENLKNILHHGDIERFSNHYHSAFSDFEQYLKREIIDHLDNSDDIYITRKENELSEELFRRLKNIPLVDPYEIYQIFHDQWQKIQVDLEIIRSEGTEAIRQVDPNIVVKKKNNIDTEVQDGWVGHILPFELVQQSLFPSELNALSELDEKLAEIDTSLEEILESLPEEETESSFVNEEKTAFVWKEVGNALKEKKVDDDIFKLLKKASALNEKEKKINKEIKEKKTELHLKTKECVENLSAEQCLELVRQKWFEPLMRELRAMPENIIRDFVSRLEKLGEKYETTLSDIDKEIAENEKALCLMLDDLVGSESDMQGIAAFKQLLGGL